MPEPGGPSLAEAEALLGDIARRGKLVGLGLTGLTEAADPVLVARLATAAGL
jgi:arginase family enzyme